ARTPAMSADIAGVVVLWVSPMVVIGISESNANGRLCTFDPEEFHYEFARIAFVIDDLISYCACPQSYVRRSVRGAGNEFQSYDDSQVAGCSRHLCDGGWRHRRRGFEHGFRSVAARHPRRVLSIRVDVARRRALPRSHAGGRADGPCRDTVVEAPDRSRVRARSSHARGGVDADQPPRPPARL